ncbi:unnamed protein product [Cyprideis torosa]|uniref:Glycine cleavage system H protein, mitochondrial n=1 Tax=Cyprideis torosa TaxID=163714 RepID=A0A7R8ZXM0_9CRUS|nr:unnamed protein product [Cyprideis torosa]CAG0910462.1 unnamed protein product [Cyprideis torosa]
MLKWYGILDKLDLLSTIEEESASAESTGATAQPKKTVAKDEVFGSVEAVKTVSDLFMPLEGELTEVNPVLEAEPEKVNADPYGEGWMVKVKISDSSQLEELLDADAYQQLVGSGE